MSTITLSRTYSDLTTIRLYDDVEIRTSKQYCLFNSDDLTNYPIYVRVGFNFRRESETDIFLTGVKLYFSTTRVHEDHLWIKYYLTPTSPMTITVNGNSYKFAVQKYIYNWTRLAVAANNPEEMVVFGLWKNTDSDRIPLTNSNLEINFNINALRFSFGYGVNPDTVAFIKWDNLLIKYDSELLNYLSFKVTKEPEPEPTSYSCQVVF